MNITQLSFVFVDLQHTRKCKGSHAKYMFECVNRNSLLDVAKS